jgi:HK97 family phage major capsid protein
VGDGGAAVLKSLGVFAMTMKELREARAAIVEKMRAIATLAETEKRDMTPEETFQFNQMDADQEALKTKIEQRDKIEKAEKELAGQVATPPPAPPLDRRSSPESYLTTEERQKRENRAFTNWVRFGFDGLQPEERMIMSRRRSFISSAELPEEARAQGVITGGVGGFLVAEGFSGELEKKLKAFGGMRDVARLFPTPQGNDIPWPVVDDTANVGELLAENTQAATQDVAFTQIILKAYKYSSKIVLVSMELLQDSFFNVDTILADLLAERIGRITNTHFTTGDNTGKPEGVVPGSGVGKVGIAGQTTSIIADDLVDLEHSVDPLYRPGSIFMMSDSTLKVIKKLKDTAGRFLWQPGLSASIQSGSETFDTILGYRYTINQDMATMAANAKSVLFGNFSKYVVRDVREFTLLRLQERYAEFGQVGFIAFTRSDGRYINASAIKHYANSAT